MTWSINHELILAGNPQMATYEVGYALVPLQRVLFEASLQQMTEIVGSVQQLVCDEHAMNEAFKATD
jgi:hypothetical protein